MGNAVVRDNIIAETVSQSLMMRFMTLERLYINS